jgi:RNA recognition motif-containing protein
MNLSFKLSEEEFRKFFERKLDHTNVRIKLLTERETGRPSGRGICEVYSLEDARVIVDCAGEELFGRQVQLKID